MGDEMTQADVDKAFKILREWETAARLKRDSTAEASVSHIEKVLRALTGRKK